MATSSFLRTVPCLLSLPCSRGTCGLERQTHRGGIFKIKNRKLRSHTKHSAQWVRQNQAHCWGLHVSQGRCCPQGGDLPTAPLETFSCTERLCQLEKLKSEARVLLHFIFFIPIYAPRTHSQDQHGAGAAAGTTAGAEAAPGANRDCAGEYDFTFSLSLLL